MLDNVLYARAYTSKIDANPVAKCTNTICPVMLFLLAMCSFFVHSNSYVVHTLHVGEHQMELLDCVAAKFHEEPGVFKLMVYTIVESHLINYRETNYCFSPTLKKMHVPHMYMQIKLELIHIPVSPTYHL